MRRLEINVERDVRCRWRRRSAAEIAMLAGVAGNEIGFSRRLVARSTGMGNAIADVREGIHRRHGKGANARQDHMQRDRIDRQQSCALPQYVTHRSDAPELHKSYHRRPAGSKRLSPYQPTAAVRSFCVPNIRICRSNQGVGVIAASLLSFVSAKASFS